MLDLDKYNGTFDTLLKLQPRAVVCASPDNYQLWLTLPDSLASKTALWATKELNDALAGDKRSAYTTQQGQLPGSINVRPGNGNTVTLLHNDFGLYYCIEKTNLAPLPADPT